MKYRRSDGSTIEAYWNHEGDSLVFKRYDSEGNELEWEGFGISPEEFDRKYADFRRVD